MNVAEKLLSNLKLLCVNCCQTAVKLIIKVKGQ